MIENYDNSNIQTFEYEKTAISNGNILGTCEPGKATIKLLNNSNEYSNLKNTWIKTIHGSFYIYDVKPVQEKVNIQLDCYDIKYKLDKAYNKEKYEKLFPTTLKEWRNAIFDDCEVLYDNSDFPNSNLMLETHPFIEENTSNRNVLCIIAQASASWIDTDENDIFYFRWFTNQIHIINDWLSLTTENEYTNKVNMVVLGRGDTEDNVVWPENEPQNKKEFRIDNNYVLDPQDTTTEEDRRYSVIQPIYNRVKDFQFVVMNIRTQDVENKLSIQLGEKVKYKDIWGNELETYIMKKKISFLGGNPSLDDNYEITLSTEKINETSSEFKYASSVPKQILDVNRKCDKLNGIIEDTIEKVGENTSSITKIKQTTDEIGLSVDTLNGMMVTEKTAEGSFIHIEDSGDAPLEEFIMKSVWEQKTTKSYQLYNINDKKAFLAPYEIDEADFITTTYDNSEGTEIKYFNRFVRPSKLLKPNTTYKIVLEVKKVSGDGKLNLISTSASTISQFVNSVVYDFEILKSNTTYIFNATTSDNARFEEADYMLRTFVAFPKSKSGSITYRISVLPASTNTDNFVYKKFTGGQPSPNPNFPQAIKVFEAGNYEVTSCSKNLFNGWIKGERANSNTGLISSNDTSARTDYIAVNFSVNNNYYLRGLTDELYSYIIAYNSKKEFLGRTVAGNRNAISLNSNVFTSKVTSRDDNEIAYIIINIYENVNVSGTIDLIDTLKTQLEIGDIESTYEPHQESKMLFTIPEGEFAANPPGMTGDDFIVRYNEADKHPHLYLQKNVGRTIYNTSDIIFSTIVYNNLKYATVPKEENSANYNNYSSIPFLYTHAIAKTINVFDDEKNIGYITTNAAKAKYWIGFPKETTLEEVQEKLNNSVLYYQLSEPYEVDLGIIDIPSTFNNITNIFTNIDLQPNMKVKYLTNSKLNAQFMTHASFKIESDKMSAEVEATKEVVQELSEVVEVYSADLDIYNITIPVDSSRNPLETKNYEVGVSTYFKGQQVTSTVSSESTNTGITASINDSQLTFSVDKNTKITNLNNEYIIDFLYIDADGKVYVISKKIILTLGLQGMNGTNGTKGDTGTGVSSITTEFYLSTSKTTLSGGSWVTTMPTWVNGKYLWTRSRIVYTNPSSTEYTTPICDSSWEAINEIEVGGRNLILNSDDLIEDTNYLIKTYTLSEKIELNVEYTLTIWGDLNDAKSFFRAYVGSGNIAFITLSKISDEVYQGKGIKTSWYDDNQEQRGNKLLIYAFPSAVTDAISTITKIKLERGNKGTDWTPAPEDISSAIGEAQEASDNANSRIDDVITTTYNLATEINNTNKNLNDNYYPKSEVDKQTNEITNNVVTITNKMNEIATDTSKSLEFINEVKLNGISKVKTTTGYTFDQDGLEIDKSTSPTKNIINEAAMQVINKSTNKDLFFAGYNKETNKVEVRTENMNVSNYAQFGSHLRVEDYEEEGEEPGYGFFYIG